MGNKLNPLVMSSPESNPSLLPVKKIKNERKKKKEAPNGGILHCFRLTSCVDRFHLTLLLSLNRN